MSLYKQHTKFQKFTILLLLGISISMSAQLVNTGQITIDPSTVVSVVGPLDNTETGELMNDGDLYLYSHFNNNGLVGFMEQGLTRFQGFDVQEITGQQESFFHNVLFNNTNGQPSFKLSGFMSIANEGRFDNGIIDNDNYGGTISFERMAVPVNPTDHSYVDGPVIKRGDASFVYPIGDGGYYRHADISAPNNEGDMYTGKYFLENSDLKFPHENKADTILRIDDTEYWKIERTQDNEAARAITLSWDERTTPYEIYKEEENEQVKLCIVRWNEEEQVWVNQGGAVDRDAKIVTAEVDGFGIFTLAKVVDPIVMPCSLNVHNAVTPNNDGRNEYFNININDGDSCYKRAAVQIFNRWGVEVFRSDNYGESGDLFRGYSEGRLTIAERNLLPAGTYFYILSLEYEDGNGQTKLDTREGYLYLSY